MTVIKTFQDRCFCYSDDLITAELVEEKQQKHWRVKDNPKALVTRCGHVFHRACIDRYIEKSSTVLPCPICRRFDWLPKETLNKWKKAKESKKSFLNEVGNGFYEKTVIIVSLAALIFVYATAPIYGGRFQ